MKRLPLVALCFSLVVVISLIVIPALTASRVVNGVILAQSTMPIKGQRPNILLVVADDIGWSDLKPFGGDIIAPNLDELANQSLLFTNFHVYPSCSSTRSVFLTGVDPHRNGLGTMDILLTPTPYL